MIVPEGVLFRGGPDRKVRMELLEQFNLHTILSLPAGCFLPYTAVKTNILFFDRPKAAPNEGEHATKAVWYYELTNDGFELQTNRRPIEGDQLPDFLKTQKKFSETKRSWRLTIDEIISRDFDLSVMNPNHSHDFAYRSALEVLQSLKSDEERILNLLVELEEVLEQ